MSPFVALRLSKSPKTWALGIEPSITIDEKTGKSVSLAGRLGPYRAAVMIGNISTEKSTPQKTPKAEDDPILRTGFPSQQ